jgi:hypothetical protein
LFQDVAKLLMTQRVCISMEDGHVVVMLCSVEFDRDRELFAVKIEFQTPPCERIAKPRWTHFDKRMLRKQRSQNLANHAFPTRHITTTPTTTPATATSTTTEFTAVLN